MNKIDNWIDVAKQIMARDNIKAEQLASSIGVTPASIRLYLKGKRTPPLDKMESLANALGVSLQYLLFTNQVNEPDFKIPVLSWENINSLSSKIKIKPPISVHKNSYALKIADDSMCNFYAYSPTFPIGTIIIVEPDAEINNNKYVIAKEKNNPNAIPIFRKYLVSTSGEKLTPLNGAMYEKEDANNFDILGVVVASMNLDL